MLAAFVIAGTAHLSLAIATEGHPSSRRRWIVASLYALNVVFAIPTILDPTLSPPHLTAAGEPEAVVFGWAWVALRLSTLSLGAAWLIAAMRDAPAGGLRRRQLIAAIATLVAGGFGAALRMVPGAVDEEPWVGATFVTLAILLATYAVLGVASSSVRRSPAARSGQPCSGPSR